MTSPTEKGKVLFYPIVEVGTSKPLGPRACAFFLEGMGDACMLPRRFPARSWEAPAPRKCRCGWALLWEAGGFTVNGSSIKWGRSGKLLQVTVSWRFRLAPPGFGKVTIKRGRRRPSHRRPACDPLGRRIKQRNHVDAGDQSPVERAHRVDEIATILRLQERGDHGINRGALDAHVIARARLIRSGRAPIERLLVARGQ